MGVQDHDAPFQLARQSELFQHFNPSAQQQLMGAQMAGPAQVRETDILLARQAPVAVVSWVESGLPSWQEDHAAPISEHLLASSVEWHLHGN